MTTTTIIVDDVDSHYHLWQGSLRLNQLVHHAKRLEHAMVLVLPKDLENTIQCLGHNS
jgi:hypothetical protein